jgi:hypothetical protein
VRGCGPQQPATTPKAPQSCGGARHLPSNHNHNPPPLPPPLPPSSHNGSTRTKHTKTSEFGPKATSACSVGSWGARRLAPGEAAEWQFETTALRGLPPSFDFSVASNSEDSHAAFVRHVIRARALFVSGTRAVEALVCIPLRSDSGTALALPPADADCLFVQSSLMEEFCCTDANLFTLLAAWRVPLPIVLLGEGAPRLVFAAAAAQEAGAPRNTARVDLVMEVKSEVAMDLCTTWAAASIPVRSDAPRNRAQRPHGPPPPRQPLLLEAAFSLPTHFAPRGGGLPPMPTLTTVAAEVSWELQFFPAGAIGPRLALPVWATDNPAVFQAAAYATGAARTPGTMRSAARVLLARAEQGSEERAELAERGCASVLLELLEDALNPLDGDAAAAGAAADALACLCRNADADASAREALADPECHAAARLWGALQDSRTPPDALLAACAALGTLSWEEGEAGLDALVACATALLAAPLPTPPQRAAAACKLLQSLPFCCAEGGEEPADGEAEAREGALVALARRCATLLGAAELGAQASCALELSQALSRVCNGAQDGGVAVTDAAVACGVLPALCACLAAPDCSAEGLQAHLQALAHLSYADSASGALVAAEQGGAAAAGRVGGAAALPQQPQPQPHPPSAVAAACRFLAALPPAGGSAELEPASSLTAKCCCLLLFNLAVEPGGSGVLLGLGAVEAAVGALSGPLFAPGAASRAAWRLVAKLADSGEAGAAAVLGAGGVALACSAALRSGEPGVDADWRAAVAWALSAATASAAGGAAALAAGGAAAASCVLRQCAAPSSGGPASASASGAESACAAVSNLCKQGAGALAQLLAGGAGQALLQALQLAMAGECCEALARRALAAAASLAPLLGAGAAAQWRAALGRLQGLAPLGELAGQARSLAGALPLGAEEEGTISV